MTETICIVVHGLPAPQGSKKHVGSGVMIESSKKVKPWREAVKWAALDVLPAGWVAIDAPIKLFIEFRMPRPKKPKANRPDRMPDLSKLIRSTEDAMTDAGVWADDARVVAVNATKVYATEGRAVGATIVVEW